MVHPNSLANLMDKGATYRFQKGQPPANKGMPWSLEYREKMAQDVHPARVEIICIPCGLRFSVAPSTAKTKRYCSQDCYTQAQKNRMPCVCEVCGAPFDVTPSELDKGRAKGRKWGRFCSAECRYKSQSGAGHPMWIKDKPTKTCLECYEEFVVPPSWSDRKFCNKRCFDKFQTGTGTKEFYYTAAWKTLSAATLLRDNYTCQYCNKRGGRLNAHHCVPIRYGGVALDLDNLITACNSCHRTEHWRIEKL